MAAIAGGESKKRGACLEKLHDQLVCTSAVYKKDQTLYIGEYPVTKVYNDPECSTDKHGRFKTPTAMFHNIPYENGDDMAICENKLVKHQPQLGHQLSIAQDTVLLLRPADDHRKAGSIEHWFGEEGLFYEMCAQPLEQAFPVPIFCLFTDSHALHPAKCYGLKNSDAYQDSDDDAPLALAVYNSLRWDLPLNVIAGFGGLKQWQVHAQMEFINNTLDNGGLLNTAESYEKFSTKTLITVECGDPMDTYVQQYDGFISAAKAAKSPEIAADYLLHMLVVQWWIKKMSPSNPVSIPASVQVSFNLVNWMLPKQEISLEDLGEKLQSMEDLGEVPDLRGVLNVSDISELNEAEDDYDRLRVVHDKLIEKCFLGGHWKQPFVCFYERFEQWAEKMGFVTVLAIGGTSLNTLQHLSSSLRLWNSRGNKKLTVYWAEHRDAPFRYKSPSKFVSAGSHNAQALDSLEKQLAIDGFMQQIAELSNLQTYRSCSMYTAAHKPRPVYNSGGARKAFADSEAVGHSVTTTSHLNKKTLKWKIYGSNVEPSVCLNSSFSRWVWSYYANANAPHIPGGNSRMHDLKNLAILQAMVCHDIPYFSAKVSKTRQHS